MGFNRPPYIFFDSDEENSKNVLGKTAHYNPDSMEVVVYVDGRHPKDVIRSLSHELVHHTQNCRGDLNSDVAGETELGYAQNNPHMRNMESEAYEKGNLCMRDWEDSVKVHLQETNYYQTRGDGKQMDKYKHIVETVAKRVATRIKEGNVKRAMLSHLITTACITAVFSTKARFIWQKQLDTTGTMRHNVLPITI
jgi:hypothetical protein